MALYKTTTDQNAHQNVDTTWQDPTHYWDFPCIENFTKLILLYKKTSFLHSQYPTLLYTLCGEIHVNAVYEVNLHKLQRKYS